MKKLLLLFLIFICSNVFSADVIGLNYTTDSGVLTDSNATHFIISIKENSTVFASEEVIRKDSSFSKQVYLVLKEGATLFNKDNNNLKIDSSITVLMQGLSGQLSKIDSRGKNLTIDGNLFIQGPSVVSSSGLKGNNGSWHGPKDEGDCGRCGNYDTKCSIDNDSSARYAKPGSNAGILLLKNVFVFSDVNFSANGGSGGTGAFGNNEGSGGHEAIRGGNGGKGGNSNKIEVQNLFADSGVINFNSSGGTGGTGGKGGNNSGAGGAHDGGDGGKGGNSTGKILINNLTNDSAEINVFLVAGKAGSGGAKGKDDGGAGCDGDNGRGGSAGSSTADFSLPVLSGFAPKTISARNIEVKAKVLEDLSFFAGTKYIASENIIVSGCRIKGTGTELTDEGLEQIELTALSVDVNVWNPAWFFDRVLVNSSDFSYGKNKTCNLNQRQLMSIPFNGRIRGVENGLVKNIRIINSVSSQTEFNDLDEFGMPNKRVFSNGVFSAKINAELYPNFFYKAQFTVCNSNESSCENFNFDFFTWKRLW